MSRREVEEWGPDDVTKYALTLGDDFVPYFESKEIDGRALLQCGDKVCVCRVYACICMYVCIWCMCVCVCDVCVCVYVWGTRSYQSSVWMPRIAINC